MSKHTLSDPLTPTHTTDETSPAWTAFSKLFYHMETEREKPNHTPGKHRKEDNDDARS